MALSRIATVLGGLLLSKGGRRLAGRHAGKLALATLAWELYQQHRGRGAPQTAGTRANPRSAQGTSAGTTQGTGSAAPHPRRRWSGRKGR